MVETECLTSDHQVTHATRTGHHLVISLSNWTCMTTFYYSIIYLRSGLSKSRRHKEIAGTGGSDSHSRHSHCPAASLSPSWGDCYDRLSRRKKHRHDFQMSLHSMLAPATNGLTATLKPHQSVSKRQWWRDILFWLHWLSILHGRRVNQGAVSSDSWAVGWQADWLLRDLKIRLEDWWWRGKRSKGKIYGWTAWNGQRWWSYFNSHKCPERGIHCEGGVSVVRWTRLPNLLMSASFSNYSGSGSMGPHREWPVWG